MKFLVDSPLGGLIKWLRFCGFDTTSVLLYQDDPGSLPPPAAGAHILTRQKSFKRLRRPDILILTADQPQAQVEEVIHLLKLSRRDFSPLSRCSRCNELLAPVAREQVQARVPEHVFLYHHDFYECPRCHRLFWPGSHLAGITQKMLEKLAD